MESSPKSVSDLALCSVNDPDVGLHTPIPGGSVSQLAAPVALNVCFSCDRSVTVDGLTKAMGTSEPAIVYELYNSRKVVHNPENDRRNPRGWSVRRISTYVEALLSKVADFLFRFAR